MYLFQKVLTHSSYPQKDEPNDFHELEIALTKVIEICLENEDVSKFDSFVNQGLGFVG